MWLDDTKVVPLKTYEDSKERYFDLFSKTVGVIDFGQFGSVNAPGLSDLDLCVLVDDEILTRKELILPQASSDLEKYIFLHPPMVIPASLLHALPYYHLIKIHWQNGTENIDEVKDFRNIVAINVFFKTIYLQSFLFAIKWRKTKSCKRTILALTSLCRSFEWSGKIGVNLGEEEQSYCHEVADLRSQWLNPGVANIDLTAELDRLLESALLLSIDFPEKLLTQFLQPTKKYEIDKRVLYDRPFRFLLEAQTTNPPELLKSVSDNKFLQMLLPRLGKYHQIIGGKLAFVGPLGMALSLKEFQLSKVSKTSFGGHFKGSKVSESLMEMITMKLGETLTRRVEVNSDYAEILNKAGLSHANFGSVSLDNSLKSKTLNIFSAISGRLNIFRVLEI